MKAGDRSVEERRLRAQYEIARVLGGSNDLPEAAPSILHGLCDALDFVVGQLWIADTEAGGLRWMAAWHPGDAGLEAFVSDGRARLFLPGRGLPGRVLASRSPIWMADLSADPEFLRKDAAAASGLRSGVGFPILLGGAVLGVFEFFSPEDRSPDPRLLEMMASIGSQIGQFIQRMAAQQALEASEARKSAMLQAALDCVISMDHRGRIVEFNPAAEETFGYRRRDVIGKRMDQVIVPPALREAHRAGLKRYLETGVGKVIGHRLELVALRADGTEFPVELAISRVNLPGPPLFTGFLRDITVRKRIEAEREQLLQTERDLRARAESLNQKLSTLQWITEAALTYLDVDELLSKIVERLLSALGGDSGVVLLAAPDGASLSVRYQVGLDHALPEETGVSLDDGILGAIAQTAQPQIVDDLAGSQAGSAQLSAGGVVSVVGVPLIAQRTTIGVLAVGSGMLRRFTREDASLLDLAGERIALALERANLFEREQKIAETLQRSLLPESVPALDGVEAAVRYLPGGPLSAVGGDWYDVFSLPDGRVAVVIGDVVGKGVRAAAVMGQLRQVMRAYALEGYAPSAVLSRVNRFSQDLGGSYMATACYGVLEPRSRRLTLANAGHPPPLLLPPDRPPRYLELRGGMPLATSPDVSFVDEEVPISPSDTLLLYTDGLIERRRQGLDEGLQALASAAASGPPGIEALCDHVLAVLFKDRVPQDDVALVALRAPA